MNQIPQPGFHNQVSTTEWTQKNIAWGLTLVSFRKRESCKFFQSASGFLISVVVPTIFKEPSDLNPNLLIWSRPGPNMPPGTHCWYATPFFVLLLFLPLLLSLWLLLLLLFVCYLFSFLLPIFMFSFMFCFFLPMCAVVIYLCISRYLPSLKSQEFILLQIPAYKYPRNKQKEKNSGTNKLGPRDSEYRTSHVRS